MTILSRKHLGILFATLIFVLLATASPLWAKSNAGFDLNLTQDQIKALEGVVNDLGDKQVKIAGERGGFDGWDAIAVLAPGRKRQAQQSEYQGDINGIGHDCSFRVRWRDIWR